VERERREGRKDRERWKKQGRGGIERGGRREWRRER
jgi:hypothetical protein